MADVALTGTPRASLLVATGSAVGALARWQIADVFGTTPGEWPWETLIVNLLGCLVIGLAAATLRPASDRWYLIVTGVLGGFTTFSAFANEVRHLIDSGHLALAGAYLSITLAGGLGAVELGRRVAP